MSRQIETPKLTYLFNKVLSSILQRTINMFAIWFIIMLDVLGLIHLQYSTKQMCRNTQFEKHCLSPYPQSTPPIFQSGSKLILNVYWIDQGSQTQMDLGTIHDSRGCVLSLYPSPPPPFWGKNGKIGPKNVIFWKFFDQPSRFSQICYKILWNFMTPPPPLKFSLDPFLPPRFLAGIMYAWGLHWTKIMVGGLQNNFQK